ncbi:MAG: hypothetical protein PHY27_13530, partial [Parabacteroides sp.]|nr:hypothetical protein [Parabacteroides sp.]
MDGEITPQDAQMLNQHILACKECKETFLIYDGMMNEMSDMPKIAAPKGFECAVMAKIAVLPQTQSVYSRRDRVKILVAGTFAMLLSIAALLIGYRDVIISNLAKNEHFGVYMHSLIPLVERVEIQKENVIGIFNSAIISVEHTLSASAGFIVTGIVVLCVVQAAL